MKKKTRVITVIDPAYKGDKSIMTTAAVRRDGTIHILNMEEVPSPVFTPKPINWSERIELLKNTLEKGELKFSQFAVDSLKDWSKPSGVIRLDRPKAPIYRPPSTHKRVFKKGRRIKTIAALDKHLSSGGWIFWGHQKRAVHPGWVMSWQYQMVRNSLGRMWKAVRI